MKNRIWIWTCFLLSFLLFSCDSPSTQNVKEAFLKDNPANEIVSIAPVEGDTSTVYFEIRHRAPKEEGEHKEIWQYIKTDSGSWVLNSKTADP